LDNDLLEFGAREGIDVHVSRDPEGNPDCGYNSVPEIIVGTKSVEHATCLRGSIE
jgi:hypothetical protein